MTTMYNTGSGSGFAGDAGSSSGGGDGRGSGMMNRRITGGSMSGVAGSAISGMSGNANRNTNRYSVTALYSMAAEQDVEVEDDLARGE